jgi:hypothetical protein
MSVATNSQEITTLKFIRASLLLAGFEIFLTPYTIFAFAQPDPTKVLIGRWEGRIEEHFPGSNDRTLIIRSVEPNETGWFAQGEFWAQVGISGFRIRKGIDVSLQDDLIVLQFTNPGNDSFRLVLTGDNRLEGTLYFAQYRGSGIGMRTLHLSLEKNAGPRRGAKE